MNSSARACGENDAFEWWQAGVGSGRMEQPVSSRLSLSHHESLLLNFASHAEREAACEAVARARLAMQLPPLPPPPESRLPAATEAWRVGRMSNFDYLMLLNECAGRSLNDLTQYPVLSHPISPVHSLRPSLSDAHPLRALASIPPSRPVACPPTTSLPVPPNMPPILPMPSFPPNSALPLPAFSPPSPQRGGM